MEYFANFADEVFFLLLVVVLIMSLVDWLIGEQGRQTIRDRVGLFGIWLENQSYWELMNGVMQGLYARLHLLFSGPFFLASVHGLLYLHHFYFHHFSG